MIEIAKFAATRTYTCQYARMSLSIHFTINQFLCVILCNRAVN